MEDNENVTLFLGGGPSFFGNVVRGLGGMFYVRDPKDSIYQHSKDVPNFYQNAWPYLLVFMILENLVLWLQKKPTVRLNDTVTSISHGVIQECGRLIFRGSEGWAYIHLFNNYRLAELDWESPLTWYLALMGVDFCYYWVHRASHEVHIFWAQHQVHHSSEEYNLAVGLRQSLLQSWCSFIFYLPLALIIPPSHFLVHQQFNLLYQFWIHTKTVDSLGPLELIFNTPKHHRVHHGCNLYCIDKNYGGFLIIWDRIFGTFAAERPKEEIVYGLVFQQPSFNPFFLQVFYNQNIVDKWKSVKGLGNKFGAIFKGPSWVPGAPWTGVHEDKIDIRSREKYDIVISTWCNSYLAIHFVTVLFGFQQLLQNYLSLNPVVVLAAVAYIIFSLTTIGMLFDNVSYAGVLEAGRCLLLVILYQKFPVSMNPILSVFFNYFFGLSAILWLLQSFQIIQITNKTKTS